MPNGKGKKDEVIDPRDPNAQRKFQIQQRGGAYSDRVKKTPEQYYKRLSHPALQKV